MRVDYSCAISATLAMHGRMYPTSSHLCFYSNVFGRERKVRCLRVVVWIVSTLGVRRLTDSFPFGSPLCVVVAGRS